MRLIRNQFRRGVPALTPVFALIFFLTVGVSAASATDNAGIIQGYLAEEDRLFVFLSDFDPEAPSADRYSAFLNDTPVSVSAADRADKQPVTYYCLADISGSLNDEQMEQEKSVLFAIRERLKPEDRMVIARLGNEIAASDYLADQDEIANLTEALVVQRTEDTNLYGGIVDSLNDLRTNQQATARKCLVILSDGQDDQKSSYTKDEVDRAVLASRIPVYSVAVMKSSESRNESRIQYAKILGGFSRESAGGIYFNPVLSENCETASDAGAFIIKSVNNGVRLTLDIAEIDMTAMPAGSVPLEIQYRFEDTAYTDTIEVRTMDLPSPTPQPTETPTPSPTPKPDPVTNSLLPWILIALALCLLIIVIFAWKRKKQAEEERRRREEESRLEEERRRQEEEQRRLEEERREKERAQNVKPKQAPEPIIPTRSVSFAAIGYRNIYFHLRLPEGKAVTLGRDSRADFVLNPNDKKLSGVNTRVSLRDQYLLVTDAGSTNGTAVNGVPLTREMTVKLTDNGLLRMGSYEYRVHFSPREDM